MRRLLLVCLTALCGLPALAQTWRLRPGPWLTDTTKEKLPDVDLRYAERDEQGAARFYWWHEQDSACFRVLDSVGVEQACIMVSPNAGDAWYFVESWIRPEMCAAHKYPNIRFIDRRSGQVKHYRLEGRARFPGYSIEHALHDVNFWSKKQLGYLTDTSLILPVHLGSHDSLRYCIRSPDNEGWLGRLFSYDEVRPLHIEAVRTHNHALDPYWIPPELDTAYYAPGRPMFAEYVFARRSVAGKYGFRDGDTLRSTRYFFPRPEVYDPMRAGGYFIYHRIASRAVLGDTTFYCSQADPNVYVYLGDELCAVLLGPDALPSGWTPEPLTWADLDSIGLCNAAASYYSKIASGHYGRARGARGYAAFQKIEALPALGVVVRHAQAGRMDTTANYLLCYNPAKPEEVAQLLLTEMEGYGVILIGTLPPDGLIFEHRIPVNGRRRQHYRLYYLERAD